VGRVALYAGSIVVCSDVWPMSNETDKNGREMKPKPFGVRDAT
jgi:hypothetical protein